MAEIKTGEFGEPGLVSSYRREWLGEMLVERIVWDELGEPRLEHATVVAGTGYIWFRFWLPRHQQVVERYFDANGVAIGTKIDLCSPFDCGEVGCRTTDLLLDVWIDRDGRVSVGNEQLFDEAIRAETLSEAQAAHAEHHLRQITAAIARGRFPPAIVRNWQVDLRRINNPEA